MTTAAPWETQATATTSAPSPVNDPFADPQTPGSGVKITDFEGNLLLLTVLTVETGIPTTFGPSDAVKVDLAVLDGPNAGQTHPDTLIFQRVLQGQLKAKAGGGMVLGRLGRSATAKPGQSPAWILEPPTEADKDLGRRWITTHPAF